MIYKKNFIIYLFLGLLLSGCGEDFLAGVTKGGSGNGGPLNPGNPGFEDVINPTPLKSYYNIILSKPQTDYCQGVKRTLYFLNPLDQKIVEKNQTVEISPQSKIDHQIHLQARLENQTDQTKYIFKPSCDGLFDIHLIELDKDELTSQMLACDMEEIIALEKNKIYILNQTYKFNSNIKGSVALNPSIETLPFEQPQQSCTGLNLDFEIIDKDS